MIVDLLIGLVVGIVQPVIDLLPNANVTFPGASTFSDALCKINTLVPILGPLQLALGILGAVVAFIGLRVLLMLRYIFLP